MEKGIGTSYPTLYSCLWTDYLIHGGAVVMIKDAVCVKWMTPKKRRDITSREVVQMFAILAMGVRCVRSCPLVFCSVKGLILLFFKTIVQVCCTTSFSECKAGLQLVGASRFYIVCHPCLHLSKIRTNKLLPFTYKSLPITLSITRPNRWSHLKWLMIHEEASVTFL